MITLLKSTQTFNTKIGDVPPDVRLFEDPLLVGKTVREFLRVAFPGFTEFPCPTVVGIQRGLGDEGDALLREDWDKVTLQDGDRVFVVQFPQMAAYIVQIVVMVLAVAIAFLMRPAVNTQPNADPVYTLKGRSNQVRLGDPIEVLYGRNRSYPSYAAIPYNRYENGEQFLYSLYCVGQGEFEFEGLYIEDTPISDFNDVTYEICPPGTDVTLFADNIETSLEISAIELLGSNEEGYAIAGPFIINSAGTTTEFIEIDLALPQGLYSTNSKGKMRQATVAVLFEYLLVNDVGTPLGSWTTLFSRSYTMSTVNAQRFSYKTELPAGRYSVRARRTTLKDLDNSKIVDRVVWEAARAYLPSQRNFGNVTVIAVKAKASYQLNDSTARAFNTWSIRKLPIYNGGTGVWSSPTATRSPVWAFCDLFRSPYGGQMGADKLDLTNLLVLQARWDSLGRNFDYMFSERTGVWDAAKVIAGAVRAIPFPAVSVITMIEDVPHTVPSALFNPFVMVPNSFDYTIRLPEANDFDGILVSYISPQDGLEDTLLCLDGTDAGDNPEKVSLCGCTDPTWAYRDGLYLRRRRKYIRENVSFGTGLEGMLPELGSAIGVSSDVPDWGQSGRVLALTGDVLTLSEPVEFGSDAEEFVIAFRTRDGSMAGPYAVTETSNPYEVELVTSIDPDLYDVRDNEEAPVFVFGRTNEWAKMVIVTNIEPGGNDTDQVHLSGYVYVDVFAGDTETPVLPEIPSGVLTPTIPILTCSSVSVAWAPGSNTQAVATWSPADGATSYELQKSVDEGETWDILGTVETETYLFPCNEGPYQLRIRPIGTGIGAWCVSDWNFTEEADPWEDPRLPGTIDELNGAGLGEPSGAIAVQSLGGSESLLGFGSYDGTDPLRRWRRRTFSGSMSCLSGLGSCVGLTVTGAVGQSGSQYVEDDGSTTNTAVATPTFGDGCGYATATTISDAYGLCRSSLGSAYCRTTTGTKTTWQSVGGPTAGDCCTGDGTNYYNNSGTVSVVLSEEDNFPAAIARLMSASDWGDVTNTAIQTIPSSGITIQYRKARFGTYAGSPTLVYTPLTGLPPQERFAIRAKLKRRTVDPSGSATGAYSSAGEVYSSPFVSALDGTGGAEWTEIEPIPGYEIAIDNLAVVPF